MEVSRVSIKTLVMRTQKKAAKHSRPSLLTATTAQLYELRVDGFSDAEIAKTLRISHSELTRLDETLYAELAFEVASEKPDRTFAKYKLEQRRNIKALNELVHELDGNTQYNAVLGAIRLRAELLDRIIDTGQKLGVMAKAATRHEHSGAVAHLVSQMSPPQLRDSIKQLSQNVQQMVDRHGDKKFLELEEGEMYYGEAANVIDVPGEAVASSNDQRPITRPKKKKRSNQGRSIRIS